jgi:integrase
MRKPPKPRAGQTGAYWLSKKPGRTGDDDVWHRTWYDRKARQTRRAGLGTVDFHEATLALANWVVANGDGSTDTRPDKVKIERILNYYWHEHAQKLVSAKSAWNGLAYWSEYWARKTVADITAQAQRGFHSWLAAKGLAAGGIDRVISDGRAALNYARKWQIVNDVPHIFLLQTAWDRRARAPMGRPITLVELARLMDAAKSQHMLTYLIIAANTLARPAAILDLRASQYDVSNNVVDLNPPERKQNKKHRPMLPVTPTLKMWLQGRSISNQRYVSYGGSPTKSIKTAWARLRETAGLDARVNPYSIRHGMARELRKRKVPGDQISLFLGHLPKGSDATTSIYAPYDPDYCSEAVAAIEAVMAEVRTHLTVADLDRPIRDVAALARSIPSATKGGIGEAKREEVRRLILAGHTHQEVVLRAKVSSGTVSAIRRDIRHSFSLYRNSGQPKNRRLRATCVPKNDDSANHRLMQAVEKNGGPGGTRTPDQTVMSGQL